MRGVHFSPTGWLMRRVQRESMRFSPEARAALTGPEAFPLTWLELPAVLAALRALPDGAGVEAVAAALSALLPAPPSELEGCWFCGRSRAEQRRVIAGPKARICEDCARSAAAGGTVSALPAAATESRRCDFCGKWSGADAWLVGGETRLFQGHHATICGECVSLCIEMFDRGGQRSRTSEH
jgi:hypothetical protein